VLRANVRALAEKLTPRNAAKVKVELLVLTAETPVDKGNV